MTLPAAVPEIPVAQHREGRAYYTGVLGFTLDWGDEQGGIAGISRGHCRLFLANPSFREPHGNTRPMLFWINLESKAAVDTLFAEWNAATRRSSPGPKTNPGSCASSSPPISTTTLSASSMILAAT